MFPSTVMKEFNGGQGYCPPDFSATGLFNFGNGRLVKFIQSFYFFI
jgi:hypothetical protein